MCFASAAKSIPADISPLRSTSVKSKSTCSVFFRMAIAPPGVPADSTQCPHCSKNEHSHLIVALNEQDGRHRDPRCLQQQHERTVETAAAEIIGRALRYCRL